MTLMMGIDGIEAAHPRPMTAQIRGDDFVDTGKQLYMFTSRDNALVEQIAAGEKAIATFTSRSHDLFATLHGQLTLETSREIIDELWSPFVAAWFEQGKQDPKLRLLCFDVRWAEVWLDDSSVLAGIKMVFGMDPTSQRKGHAAKLNFH